MEVTKNEERLYQWAVNNSKKLSNTCEQETNWQIKDAAGDRIAEYDIETLKDMQECVENEGTEKEVSLIFSAEAMRWKMQYFKEKETESAKSETGLPASQDIPDFVYRF